MHINFAFLLLYKFFGSNFVNNRRQLTIDRFKFLTQLVICSFQFSYWSLPIKWYLKIGQLCYSSSEGFYRFRWFIFSKSCYSLSCMLSTGEIVSFFKFSSSISYCYSTIISPRVFMFYLLERVFDSESKLILC